MRCRFHAPIFATLAAMAPAFPSDLALTPDHWLTSTPDLFTFADGALTAARRSNQSATIESRDEFENFALEFEFTLQRWCELNLVLHAPWNEAYAAGLEIVLNDEPGSRPSENGTGAIRGHVPPSTVTINKDGEWNACSVVMDWPRLTLEINGVAVQDLDLDAHPELRHRLRRGRIVFRDLLGWGFTVRNFSLKPLPDSENAIQLFNGVDFTGWRNVRPGPATWRIEDGAIVAENGNGYRQHELAVQDFDLRLYYTASPTANGGVFFRWMSDDSDRGNEIQILDVEQTKMPSASIYNIVRADTQPMRLGGWNLLQIILRGNECWTYLNGHPTAYTDQITKVRPGHITLQMHKESATIRFKDLFLRPVFPPHQAASAQSTPR